MRSVVALIDENRSPALPTSERRILISGECIGVRVSVRLPNMNQLALERLKQAMYELRVEVIPGGIVRTADLRALINLAHQLELRVSDLEAELAAETALNDATQRTLQEAGTQRLIRPENSPMTSRVLHPTAGFECAHDQPRAGTTEAGAARPR